MVGRSHVVHLSILFLTLVLVCSCASPDATSEPAEESDTPGASPDAALEPAEEPGTPDQTPEPTPALSPIPPPEPVPDPADDLFDNHGDVIEGVAYLDIMETGLSSSEDRYLAMIKVQDSLPVEALEPSLFLEWGIFIDADKDPNTGWKARHLYNDTGVDYLVRLAQKGSMCQGQVFDIGADKWSETEYEIEDNCVKLTFLSDHIGNSDDFNYVFAAREYEDKGASRVILIADKAPNEQHYGQFPDSDGDGYGDDEELTFWGTDPDTAEQWDNFDVVSSILDTPERVYRYLERHYIAVRKPSTPFAVPAEVLFEEGSGDCDEYATLAACWLTKNGYEAYFVMVYFDREWEGYKNHDICVYKDVDGSWYSFDIYYFRHMFPVGPFESIGECCSKVPANFGVGLSRYELYDCDGTLVEKVKK